MVVALHTLQRYSLSRHVPLFYYVLGNGGMGVFIFFVISGYLITTLLLLFFVSGALEIRFQNYWNMPIGMTVDGF